MFKDGDYVIGMDAVIYTRVSTDEQANSGLGLEAQLVRCRALCVARGWRIIEEHSDPGVSGRLPIDKRLGLSRAVEAVRTRLDAVLVVAAISRLTRKQSQLWDLLDEAGRYRLRLVSATEPFDTSSAMGRAMVGMIGVIAQLEADLVSERTKAALAAKKAQGFKLGAPGWADERPELAEKITDIHNGGGYTYQQIADRLNLEGIPGPRGGQWQYTSVRRAVLQCKRRGQSDSGVGGTDSVVAPASEQGPTR